MDTELFKRVMLEKGDTQLSLAEAVNINHCRLSEKINGKRNWSQSELVRIKEHYSLTNDEFIRIFFHSVFNPK